MVLPWYFRGTSVVNPGHDSRTMFCKKNDFLKCLTIFIILCDFWVLSYFLQRFHVFVDICVFSCLSLFLSDWPKKLWCRQCFCDFGTDLVFSYRKRST